MGAGLKFMNKLQPALQVRLQGNKPYFLSPLATTAQKIVISRVGEEPSISYGIDQIEENMRILGRQFVDMRSQRRKAFFSKRDQLANFSYDPQYVYTVGVISLSIVQPYSYPNLAPSDLNVTLI